MERESRVTLTHDTILSKSRPDKDPPRAVPASRPRIPR